MAIYFQIISTGLLSYLCITLGIITGWPSSTVNLFISPSTPLHRPMTEMEIALLGSLQSVGSLVGTPLAGFVLDSVGRKKSAIMASLMFVIAWAMIASCNQVEVILIAMFVGGVGGAAFLVITVYISEICQDSIRGAMTSAPILCYCFGITISYMLGGWLTYQENIYVSLTMAVIAVAVLGMMKESPTILLAKDLEKNAAESIAFYRREKIYSTEVLQEMDKIRCALNPDMGEEMRVLTSEQLSKKIKAEEKMSTRQFFQKSPSTQRALVISLLLMAAFIFQGFPVVQVYAEPLFVEAVSSEVMSANMCSILTGIVSLVAGLLAAYLTDVAGRRPLMIYSSVITGLCCIVLGTQIGLEWGPKYLTAIFMYLYTIFYTIGAGTVPFVFVAEVFLPEVKSLMSMLVVQWTWLCNFLILFSFPPLVSALGLAPVFYFFGTVCFATSLFCIYFVPETKGQPIDAIQKLLKGGQSHY